MLWIHIRIANEYNIAYNFMILEILFKMVHYKMDFDIWRFKGGPQKYCMYTLYRKMTIMVFFSSPEHEVLKVSYCDWSDVHHPLCCVNDLL